ncbi:sterol desaturase family protein [Brevundimonas sp.]|uniref:sterol desaturase family protein n=1 Tax=Brevundimonas sp. TaxID=1871086 RepID=UPI00286D30DD|nr:sterol desaturase family protein [Brevundimonas sp.]
MTVITFFEALAAALSAAILIMLPIELWSRRRSLNIAALKEMAASAGVLLPALATSGLVLAFVSALMTTADALTPWRIPTTWWSALLCLLLVDFLFYWDHRIAHRVRSIWAVSHSVHHSSHQFDQTTGLRVSFADGFISPWFYLPAVLTGFDPLLVAASFGVMVGYQQWLHTETIGRLGWFDRVFNSPANHRVHHGSQDHYLDKNYGGILIVWDRLFGTWEPEGEQPVYGLTTPIGSSHLWTVHTAEIGTLWRDLKAAGSWRDRLRLLLAPPGTVAP